MRLCSSNLAFKLSSIYSENRGMGFLLKGTGFFVSPSLLHSKNVLKNIKSGQKNRAIQTCFLSKNLNPLGSSSHRMLAGLFISETMSGETEFWTLKLDSVCWPFSVKVVFGPAGNSYPRENGDNRWNLQIPSDDNQPVSKFMQEFFAMIWGVHCKSSNVIWSFQWLFNFSVDCHRFGSSRYCLRERDDLW